MVDIAVHSIRYFSSHTFWNENLTTLGYLLDDLEYMLLIVQVSDLVHKLHIKA